MTGKNQLTKPKKSLNESSTPVPKHVAIVIDAWFPNAGQRPGMVGGGQIRVREIIKRLENKRALKTTLFFPAYPHVIYRSFWTLIATIRIIQQHRKSKYQIIHSHGLNSGIAAYWAGRFLKVPVVHSVHGSPHLDTKAKSPAGWFEHLVLTRLKYTAQISVSTNFLKYPNINKQIFVVPNGVDVTEFDDVEVEKSEAPTLIWVGGRNDSTKGLKYLKQAIVKIRKKMPDLKTKLITGGQLTGTNLIKAYKRSHVFVLSSIAESQPVTLLEAWAAKLPVVVTDVGDNKSMVKDGVNGYLVEPGNVAQLTNAIMKVLRARTKNLQMGENGYKLVKAEYSWDRVADETWKVYEEVLSSKSKV